MAKKNDNTTIVLLGIGVIAFAGLGGLSRARGFLGSFRNNEESTDTEPVTEEQQGSNQTENDALNGGTTKDPTAGGNASTNFFFTDSSFSSPGFPSAARNQTPFGDPSDPLGAFRGTTFFRDTDQREVSEGFSPFRANVRPPRGSGTTRTVGVANPNATQNAIRNTIDRNRGRGAVNSSNSRTGSVTQDIIDNLRSGTPITTAQPSGRGGRIDQASSVPRTTPPPPSAPTSRINTSVFQPSTGFGGGSRTVTRNPPTGTGNTRGTLPNTREFIGGRQPPPRREEPVDRRLARTTNRSGRATQNARFRRF